MKRIIALLFISTLTLAGVDWFGYYEGQIDYGRLPGQQIYMDYHKFRLDWDSSPSENMRVSGDIIFKHHGGQTTLNLLDFLKPRHTLLNPLNTNDTLEYVPYTLTDTVFFDNIFLEFHHDLFDLTVGRQQLPSGVGYTWNPTDIFNQKDVMDPTYENPGVDAFKLEIPLGLKCNLTGILQPVDSWNNTSQYYEIKTYLGHFDLSALYGRHTYDRSGYTLYDTLITVQKDAEGTIISTAKIADVLLPSMPQATVRDLYGFNLEGELLGMGLRTELAVSRLNYESNNLRYEYIIGGDYTFKNSLYILTEYYHNDFGIAADQTTFYDYAAYFNWECKSLNQNYLFLLGMYPLRDILDFSLFGIANLDDGSLVIAPQLIYRIFQNVEINVLGSLFLGEATDEYGYQDYGLRVRLRAYF